MISQLNLSLTPQQLAGKISADAPQNKVLINLHVTDHDPAVAANLANAVAVQFDKVVQNTEQTDANGKPVVKLTVIHPAGIPSSPVKPNKILNIGLGFVIGLLLGVGIVILRDVLDNTVKNPSDFEELGVPVLGMVPFDKRTAKTPIAFRGDPHSLRSEAYRLLRTNMQFLDVDNAPRIIAVTSAVPGEGKSTTAINLAAALAEAGYRVCLIEADLRRPTLAQMLGLVPDVGFTTVLIGRAPLETALQNAGRNLAVLTSGPVPPNPSELLVTAQAGAVIRQVAEQVDYTIIDTAPLLPVADGAEVAALADATLVVHRAGKTTKDQAARAVETLKKIGERPVGVILNMVTRGSGRYDYEYSYYYSYRPERSRTGDRAAATRESDSARRVEMADLPGQYRRGTPRAGSGCPAAGQRVPTGRRPCRRTAVVRSGSPNRRAALDGLGNTAEPNAGAPRPRTERGRRPPGKRLLPGRRRHRAPAAARRTRSRRSDPSSPRSDLNLISRVTGRR